MNKELTPLEALNIIHYLCSTNINKYYFIIEKALKELEFYRKRDKQFKQDVNNVADKLKALEIIKNVVRKDSILNHLNDWLKIGVITQEQYDLLKEVLK